MANKTPYIEALFCLRVQNVASGRGMNMRIYPYRDNKNTHSLVWVLTLVHPLKAATDKLIEKPEMSRVQLWRKMLFIS